MIYGIPWTLEDEQEAYGQLDNTINSFLNSSLNIELVHIILKSITDDCKDQDKSEVQKHHWHHIYKNFDKFNITKKRDFYEITIEDPQGWAVDKFSKDKDKTIENSKNEDVTITEDIEVTQLAPEIFNCIRKVDNVTNEDIINSLDPTKNKEMAFKAGEGSGKSGSFFFFSHDRSFIIKTMTNGEYKTFLDLFKSYMHHLMKHRESFLARIYGIFTVKIEKLEPVHLIMMANTIQSIWNKMDLKYMFDLKGSLVNRETKINMKRHKPGITLKDINLLGIRKDEHFLKFSLNDRAKITSMIDEDIRVLSKHKIMDYSLLLAVEKSQLFNTQRKKTDVKQIRKDSIEDDKVINESHLVKSSSLDINVGHKKLARNTSNGGSGILTRRGVDTSFFVPTRHRFLSYNGEYIYHLAIIDYLQEYNWDKKSEHYAKTIFRGSGAEISSVPPVRYMKRFIEFMESEVIIDDKNSSSRSHTTK